MENRIFYITEEEEDRIDKYLSDSFDNLSRSFIQKLIKEGFVTVNDKEVKANYKISCGDKITFTVPELITPETLPEDIPLDILYEDKDIIVVNKPKGMVVHPAYGHCSGTLCNALLYHCQNLSGINGVLRPGIVHRIDMDTTGVLVACKNDNAHHNLAEQFKVHSITRRYHAIVHGILKAAEGTVDAPIGRPPIERKKMSVHSKKGKNAVTHYKVLQYLKGYTYIECSLETGRTHQIRVHMASISHPILGDSLYGPSKCPIAHLQGQTLHAKTLGFLHPTTREYIEFDAPLPKYFLELLEKLKL